MTNHLKINITIVLLIVVFCFTSCDKQKNYKGNSNEIQDLITKSKNNSIRKSQRVEFSIKAYNLARSTDSDSILPYVLKQTLKLTWDQKNDTVFKSYYTKAINYSVNGKDRLLEAKIYNYIAYHYERQNKWDSAYYYFHKGSKMFEKAKDTFMTGKMFLNMAIIQKNRGDYIGAEYTSIDALKFLEKTNKQRYIASAYNNLGIISNELDKFKLARHYHNIALEKRKLSDNTPRVQIYESKNNIAVVDIREEKYNNAINTLEEINLDDTLFNNHPETKARVIDNLAYAKLLKGDKTERILNKLNLALNLRKENEDLSGIVTSYLHLSVFHRLNNSDKLSDHYLRKAKSLSLMYGSKKDHLDAIKQLMILNVDKNGKGYTEEYLTSSDSFIKSNFKNADHFARIKYETDKKDKEHKNAESIIVSQNDSLKQTKMTIFLLFIILCLLLVTLYFIKRNSDNRRKDHREFNHRTRNNLMIISSALDSSKLKSTNESDFLDLETTIHSQLLLYSILEDQKNTYKLDLKNYLLELINLLIRIRSGLEVKNELNLQSFKISATKASLIGRIVNEFITNAYKYNFLENSSSNLLQLKLEKISPNSFCFYIRSYGENLSTNNPLRKGKGKSLIESLLKRLTNEDFLYKVSNNQAILSFKVKTNAKVKNTNS